MFNAQTILLRRWKKRYHTIGQVGQADGCRDNQSSGADVACLASPTEGLEITAQMRINKGQGKKYII